MIVLGIESATDKCSVALAEGHNVFQVERTSPIGHSQVVLDLVKEVLDESGISLESVELLAADVGPGSFTGLRVGLGVAKALAYGRRLPVVGFTSLEILAVQGDSGLVVPALDARMNEVYVAVYELTGDDRPVMLEPARVCTPGDVPLPASRKFLGLGSGWDRYGGAMVEPIDAGIHCLSGRTPEARDLVHLARQTNAAEWSRAVDLEAAYIRDQVVQAPKSPVNPNR